MAFRFSPSKIVTDGLVVYLDPSNYRSYNGGTDLFDLSGNENHGSLTGATYSSDNFGTISCDGAGDYVRIPGNTPVLSTIVYYTLEIWIKMSHAGNKVVSEKGSNKKMVFQPITTPSDSLFYADLEQTSSPVSGGTFMDGNWHQWACSIDDSNVANFYVDGVLRYSAPDTATVANSDDITLMGRATAFSQAGSLGAIKIYDKSLTESEVLQNYNALKSRYGL